MISGECQGACCRCGLKFPRLTLALIPEVSMRASDRGLRKPSIMLILALHIPEDFSSNLGMKLRALPCSRHRLSYRHDSESGLHHKATERAPQSTICLTSMRLKWLGELGLGGTMGYEGKCKKKGLTKGGSPDSLILRHVFLIKAI